MPSSMRRHQLVPISDRSSPTPRDIDTLYPYGLKHLDRPCIGKPAPPSPSTTTGKPPRIQICCVRYLGTRVGSRRRLRNKDEMFKANRHWVRVVRVMNLVDTQHSILHSKHTMVGQITLTAQCRHSRTESLLSKKPSSRPWARYLNPSKVPESCDGRVLHVLPLARKLVRSDPSYRCCGTPLCATLYPTFRQRELYLGGLIRTFQHSTSTPLML